MKYITVIGLFFFTNFIMISFSYAGTLEKVPEKTNEEKVNVDQIKEKYWARGDESELGVVQNRLYSNKKKIEFGFYAGIVSSDPFLSIRSIGTSFGYHFSELLAIRAFGWKNYASPSSALRTFEDTIHATTNNNPPRWFCGGEGTASVLYGKLSLLGEAIIYYDFHLSGGGGITVTDSGNYLTPFLGLGQNVYLTQFLSLRIDYRIQRYTEKIVEKVITPKLGQVVDERENWSHAITLGISVLWGGKE